eukprot:2077269-Rhodomonas_salina.1
MAHPLLPRQPAGAVAHIVISAATKLLHAFLEQQAIAFETHASRFHINAAGRTLQGWRGCAEND